MKQARDALPVDQVGGLMAFAGGTAFNAGEATAAGIGDPKILELALNLEYLEAEVY